MQSEYFNTTLDKLKTENYSELTIVLGNESCDLDSAVCAIVYAMFLNWQNNKIKCKVCTRTNRDESKYKDDIFIPILNVNREDFALKTEVIFCIKEHGIHDTDLVFRDDLDLNNLVKNEKVNVVLVDHHILSKNDKFLAPYVTEIIDHRPLDSENWKYKEDIRTTIELVGSCSTLVGQRIKSLSALLAKDVDFFDNYKVCSELLHSAILLDTVNFSKDVGKARPADLDMVMFLESLLKPDNYEIERKNKLERLLAAQKDVSTLTSAQLLRKDTKILGDVLVPSFPILIHEYFQSSDAMQALQAAINSNSCSVALLLGKSLFGPQDTPDFEYKRDTAIFSLDADKTKKLAKLLQEWTSPDLELSPDTLPTAPDVLYFKQRNLTPTRKQYMPIIGEYLKLYN